MSNSNGRIDFAAKRKTATVAIPELGASFTLRALSVGQLNELKRSGEVENTTKQLALAIVDENNNRIYQTDDDIANLSEMSITAMRELIGALNSLHGITEEAVDAAAKK